MKKCQSNSGVTKEFHDAVLKRFNMKPAPDIHAFDNDPFTSNPLMTFKTRQRISRKVFDRTIFKASRTKAEILAEHKDVKHLPSKPRIPMPQSVPVKSIRDRVEQIEPPSMQRSWVRDMKTRVPRNLRRKYECILERLIDEAKEEFDQGMHAFAVRKMVKPLEGEEYPQCAEPGYKFGGRTENYPNYLKTRTIIKNTLFLTRKYMQVTLVCSIQLLPAVLNDYSVYRRATGVHYCVKLAKQFARDLKQGEGIITTIWYPKLMAGLKMEWKSYEMLNFRYKRNYLKSIQCFIRLQITELMRRTIEHFLTVISDPDKIPIVYLELFYETVVEIYPSLNDVYGIYHTVLDQIAAVARHLPTVEAVLGDTTGSVDYFKVELSKSYLEEAHKRLQVILIEMFGPVIKYLQCISVKFASLYGETAKREMRAFSRAVHTFEEGCDRIEYYNNYIRLLREMVDNEYFAVCKLHQRDFLDSMTKCAQDLMNYVLKNMVDAHYQMNLNICNEFETLAKKALQVPTCSEELMASGEYFIWARTIYMEEMHERVTDSVNVMGKFMEITTLSTDHVELNTKTINWMQDIMPIFEENASIYETYKFQFEENLVTVIASLEFGIHNMIMMITSYFDRMNDLRNIPDYICFMRKFAVTVYTFDETKEWVNKEEALFKFGISEYPLLENLKDFVFAFYHLIYLCYKWRRYFYLCMDGPLDYLDGRTIEATVNAIYKEVLLIQKTYKLKIRQDLVEKTNIQFAGIVDDPDILNLPAPLALCARILNHIKTFRVHILLVNIICNPALKQRHWDEMSLVAGFDVTPDAGTTLRSVIERNFGYKLDQFDIISVGATKEQQLYTNLKLMMDEWNTLTFTTSTYKDTGITILSSLDDIQALLDDHIVKTLTIRGSAFVRPFETTVRNWYDKLMRINATIEEWGKVQSQWLYLLPIFSSKDIVEQMPQEGILFKEVDAIYRQYMSVVKKDPRVIVTAPLAGLLEAFIVSSEMLEVINDGVNAYLEQKRLFFPRFFFLSNDEMLEILSETKDPLRVQPHLQKCFEGINYLEFDDDLNILAMFSAETEKVELDNISTIDTRGSVEKWLIQVEENMMIAIQREINYSHKNYAESRREHWVKKWPGQVVLCVAQVYWSMDVHHCMEVHDVGELKQYHSVLVKQINDVVTLIRSPTLANLTRITIKALIVIDVHAKDVVQELIDRKVAYDTDFNWTSQMRYYYKEEVMQVKIINATVDYANEYLGNSDRLVITPLTDRCYRTLVGAYHLHLNGAPEGPAGTGKTETTKDLAKAIAAQCVVFNCSDGLDYKAMGKFFKGLASTGAWACFDEFNRIELEVLSVVAQQILCIILAVRANVETFIFEGTELILNPHCYVCITMNPGYAGRSELPDNLKVLFRTVAMMVPDYAMIGEISLYSFGFVNARSLSVKIVTVYRLCSEQLSTQHHYDYGMRAVKTVLSACGNNKRKFPDENEDILLLRSITDVNLPKFLSFDVPLFEGIISDLFPGIELPDPDYDVFLTAVKKVCVDMNLQPMECVITKVIQTYEMMIVRHGFMLVGDPYAGKTSVLKILAATMTMLFNQDKGYNITTYEFLNPKSLTMGQLYGAFDPVSYEWTDGVGATLFRNYATNPTLDRKWLIFDGPVDAVWIENMNTVLDDNKKLCLTSGEIITMTNSMSMIFEAMDLDQASPATVSRCGMIYMESSSLGWEPLVTSWLSVANPLWRNDNVEFLYIMFVWCVRPALTFVRKSCLQLVTGGETNLVKTTMLIFEMFMNDAFEENDNNVEEIGKYVYPWTQACLIMALVWGVGGTLNQDSRKTFDQFLKNMWQCTDKNNPLPDILDEVEISIPNEGLLMDYIYTFKLKGSWKYWPDLVRAHKLDEGAGANAVIPTIDSVRYANQLALHIRHKIPMLLVGPTGTGKSFYIQDHLMNNTIEMYEPTFLTFTTQTSANETQSIVLSKLLKSRGGIHRPPKGKVAIIFVDDLNMPAKEKYGAQPPIELLRQYFDHGHWYDLKDTSKLFLEDILFLGAMGLPGGSRTVIYQRLLRHYCIYSINEFSDDSMVKIFSMVLLNGLKFNGFAADIMSTVSIIIASTIEVYKSAIVDLRPTPAKSHYVFNLRDIARTVQGCSMVRKDIAADNKTFPKLWIHEILRVFGDRLIEDVDREWILVKLANCVSDFFRDKIVNILEDCVNKDAKVTVETIKTLMFGTFMDTESADGDRRYELIPNIEVFRDIAEESLLEYNSTHKNKMIIVLFDYALQHLARICRIIAMPGGSALMVGSGGLGRQSLTRLCASIMNVELFQPEITNTYNFAAWRENLKTVMIESGGEGNDLVFLFTERQIKDEVFLQDIDCLLNSGDIPNLYAVDEKQEILEMVRLAAQGGNRNLDIGPLKVFNYFTNRVKAKLHMILCFSPVGSSFRKRLSLYPSLVNCCTINWMENWPEESLVMMANKYMHNIKLPHDVIATAVIACQYFHVCARKLSDDFFTEIGRKTYITSASYLDLIKAFTALTNTKQTEIMEAKMRYVIGLDKLLNAAAAVSVMQKELNILKPQLEKLAIKSGEIMMVIEVETKEAERATALVKKDEEVANIQAAASQALKRDCEADLALALPILKDALAALDTLKPADISLVKSMKNPPAPVKLVMEAVCIIKSIPPDRVQDPSGRMINDYWSASKRLLGDMAFLQNLKDFDKDNIPPAVIAKIRKDYIPQSSFKPKIVAKASSAAKGLCKWIIAMDMYDVVAAVVRPKKAKLAQAEAEFAATMEILNKKKALADRLEKKVAELNEALNEANVKKQQMEDDVNLCINKLRRAEKLIGGLGGEKKRWMQAAKNLQNLYDGIAGDVLVSCGVIAYLAPFTMAYRSKCIQDWTRYCIKVNIPCSNSYSLETVLGTEIKIENWYIAGLPRDSFSTENAIIQDTSYRWSLLVDPQGQANKWIKAMEYLNDIKVVKFSDSNYMKILEVCIELGHPALIENIGEQLEAPLDPVLAKSTFKHGEIEYISLGDNVIEYNSNFRLYLTSKLRNPHYLPEVFSKITLINFALTVTGLEDQLLGIVVAKERPDLQEKRQQLIVQSALNKTALKEVEDQILKTLSESKGDILEDETAIEILDSSKILSDDIMKKQEVAKETEIKIENFRMSYRPIAVHSSNLYYCVTDLPNVDPMYQYSLTWFIGLYITSIETAYKSRELERRLRFLRETFTINLYSNVCRSLFEKDKLLFSFILATNILLAKKELEHNEFMFYLTGGVRVENAYPNPAQDWLSDKSWDEICRLSTDLPFFRSFKDSFARHNYLWKQLYDETDPQNVDFPTPWQENCTPFQRILIIRALRPDKIIASVSKFVEKELGTKFVKPPGFDIAMSFKESNCLAPLIFILSPGADPMDALINYAEQQNMTEEFSYISLGQGQGPIAKAMIVQAQQEGRWVCLQNCHLASSWMQSLEKIWESMELSNTKLDFRLWLTSYPSDTFPTSMLQNGVKMTNEPPTGLQANLLRSYCSDPVNDPLFFGGCGSKNKHFSKLLYAICFFHAVVQERRKFGPVGWNIPYGFNESDFQISIRQLQMFMNEYEDIQYVAIAYLTGECNYGGRVTDSWDRRAIVTILRDYINPAVVKKSDYMFSNFGLEYGLPRRCEYSEYLKHIGAIPNMTPPEVFGLHMNAGITMDLQVSMILIDSMLLVQGQIGRSSGGEESEILVTSVNDILGKLREPFDLEQAKENYPVMYGESMNTVLVQEMERFNKLLVEIVSSLNDVKKALKGDIVSTAALDQIANSIILGRIPSSWASVSYPSLKSLAAYILEFVERLEFLQTWYKNGKPLNFWLSGFFFTQAFLTGALQNYARRYVIPIDTLTFDFKIMSTDRIDSAPEDGVYVYGLFTDGARWDRALEQLAEQIPKILFDTMPLIWIRPILINEFREGQRYKSPLYKTSDRKGTLSTTGHSTNYVLPIMLPTDMPVSHWIKRSVALLCQLN